MKKLTARAYCGAIDNALPTPTFCGVGRSLEMADRSSERKGDSTHEKPYAQHMESRAKTVRFTHDVLSCVSQKQISLFESSAGRGQSKSLRRRKGRGV